MDQPQEMQEPLRPARQAARKMERGMQQMEERYSNIEEATGMDSMMRAMSHVPTMAYYSLMFGSIGTSLTLFLLGRRWTALFVGLWAPTILNLGLMNRFEQRISHH